MILRFELFAKAIFFLAACWPVLFCAAGMKRIDDIETNRFSSLHILKEEAICSMQFDWEEATPYFRSRGVADSEIKHYIDQDLNRIIQSLSFVFHQDPEHSFPLFLKNDLDLYGKIEIDHAGIELYGPISFYLPLIRQISSHLDLIYRKEIIFPSVSIFKELQNLDPKLKGVSIARIFFEDQISGTVRSLELFQAAPLDETDPQPMAATEERISLLNGKRTRSEVFPIDHTAIRMKDLQSIESLHKQIWDSPTKAVLPVLENLSYNPGDGSIHTKAIFRDENSMLYNQIVEFIYYKEH